MTPLLPSRAASLAVSILLMTAVLASAQQTGVGTAAPRLTPALVAELSQGEPSHLVEVYAAFGPRIRLEDHLPAVQTMSRKDRREYTVKLLRETAAESQREVLAFLREQEDAGRARIGHHVWLNNVLAFSATRAVVAEVAAFPNVLYVNVDRRTPVAEVVDVDPAAPGGEAPVAPAGGGTTTSPNLLTINADDVWARGYTGRGVLVAVVDSRFNYDHPDLMSHNWQNPGETPGNGIDDDGNGFIDDTLGWDFAAGDNDPYSSSTNLGGDGHGTAVAGIVFGDGTSGVRTGVAPGVTAMYLAISNAPESSWWMAYQYAIDNGADVIASSSSRKFPSFPDYSGFRQATDMELLAGVHHANSIGNQGQLRTTSHPIPFNVSTPGNCPGPWRHPDQPGNGGLSGVMGCGAMSSHSSNVISSSSGRGPCSWVESDADDALGATWPVPFAPYNDYLWDGGNAAGLIKPDVTAPSNGSTQSTGNHYLGGGSEYVFFTGTSAATPHLGGLMCLLLEVDPQLTPERMAQIIQETADELGAAGKDNTYGAGRIDCLAAVDRIVDELGGLARNDVVMMTNATDLTTPLTHVRAGEAGRPIIPMPGDGVAFPTSLGNGAIEHIDNTPYCLIATNLPSNNRVFLLDFSHGATSPRSYLIGSLPSGAYDIEYEPASGNAYICIPGAIRAINGPIGPSSVIETGHAASPGLVFTAGIALEETGGRFLGATSGSVYRFCLGEVGATLLFTSQVSGANGIDVDRATGDIYVDGYGNDRVSRFDRDGNFIEDVLVNPYVDGPCDVEFNPVNGLTYTVGRNGGGRDICLPPPFGGCIFFPGPSQPGHDNVLVAGRGDGSGGVSAILQTGFAHGNTGAVANIAVVSAPGIDGDFSAQSAGETPVAPWHDGPVGVENLVRPADSCSSDGGFPHAGSRWLEVSAGGSIDATPPTGSTGPMGASTVEAHFAFDERTPQLTMEVAFVCFESLTNTTYNDFGGVVISDGTTTESIVLLDTFSIVTGQSSCHNEPMMAVGVSYDIATDFPNARTGDLFTLTAFAGNATDGDFSSRLYVDDVRLRTVGLELDIDPTSGGFSQVIRGGDANAVVLTLISAVPSCPRAQGPIAGLDISALNVLNVPRIPPVWVTLNGAGFFAASYNFGGIPPGIILEFRSVQFGGIGGGVNGVSNFEGPFIF